MTKNLKDYGKCRKCSEDGDEVATNKIFHKYGIKERLTMGDSSMVSLLGVSWLNLRI